MVHEVDSECAEPVFDLGWVDAGGGVQLVEHLPGGDGGYDAAGQDRDEALGGVLAVEQGDEK